jgi:SAM-dependent methyltransferase
VSRRSRVASRADVEAFLRSTSFSGYQEVPLPHGLKVPGMDGRARIEQVFSFDLRGRSVLDVGTFYGVFAYEALQRGAVRAVGLEPDATRHAVAQRIAELHGNRWEVRPHPVESLAPDEKFDVVLFLNVLHHVSDPVGAMRRLAGACREIVVVEFCLPHDPAYLVRLIDSAPTPARRAWWRARAQSLLLGQITKRLPLMAIGNRAYDRTFYFSPKAFDNLFRLHLGLFDAIEFAPSVMSQHRVVAHCRIRHRSG